MDKIKRSIVLVFSFLLLTGCGEAFRANEFESIGSTTETENFAPNGFRNGNTHVDIDQQILSEYAEEFNGSLGQTVSLTNSIKAVDFNMTGGSNSTLKLEAQIAFSCDKRLKFSGNVASERLQTGGVISLRGEKNSHSIRVQCTDASCRDIVMAIAQHAGGFGTVLVGMSVNSKVENTLVYLSRNVAYKPYFATFPSGSAYYQANKCSSRGGSVKDKVLDVIQEEVTDYLIKEAEDVLNGLLSRL